MRHRAAALVFALALAASAGLASVAQAAPAWLAPVGFPGTAAAVPQVALDAQGNAVAVWNDSGRVLAVTRPAGGDWSAQQTLSSADNSVQQRVALDARGDAVVVWEHYTVTGRIIQASTRPAGGGSVNDGWSAAHSEKLRPPGGGGEGQGRWRASPGGPVPCGAASRRFTAGCAP